MLSQIIKQEQERFDEKFRLKSGKGKYYYNFSVKETKDFLSQSIERAVIEKEQEIKEILEALADMYEQYCGDEYGHSFMNAGEETELILKKYGTLTGTNGMGGNGKINLDNLKL